MLGPLGKVAKLALTKGGYQLYRPTGLENTLMRSIWEDWFSTDPARFAQIYEQNRAVLSSVDSWIDAGDLDRSLWRYGVPEEWDRAHSGLNSTGLNEIEKEVTYSDLIAFVGGSLRRPVVYLEIGVSVGKNLLQVCHHFRDAEIVGLDIEVLNPCIRRQFASEEVVWQSDDEYAVDTLRGGPNSAIVRPSHHRLEHTGAAPVLYVRADQFREDTWASLRGRQFNLIFSDGVHTARALRQELGFLLKEDLIVPEGPFAMIWDDLVDISMQTAFFENAQLLQRRFGPESWFGLHWIHGTYGNRRLNGIFSSFRP